MGADYKFIDMPSMMARIVKCQHPDDRTVWIRDERWYDQIKEIYNALLAFYADKGLLKIDVSQMPIEDVVVMTGDLTNDGKAVNDSGAVDRWHDSFDRPGSKKSASNVKMLEKALARIREAGTGPH